MGKEFVSIQERSRLKALTAMDRVDDEIDNFIDSKCKTKFDMYKYLVKLGWSSRVVKFLQGQMADQIAELKNEEDDEQLSKRAQRTLNGMIDSLLRGSGLSGAAVSAIKNTILEFIDEEKKINYINNRVLLI